MRITLFAIVVPDYDAGLAFYAGALGWAVTSDLDQGSGKRWVVVTPPGGGTSVLLAKAVGADQNSVIGNQSAMLAAGGDFVDPPRAEPYGTVAVWRDPFGNRWDLIEYAA